MRISYIVRTQMNQFWVRVSDESDGRVNQSVCQEFVSLHLMRHFANINSRILQNISINQSVSERQCGVKLWILILFFIGNNQQYEILLTKMLYKGILVVPIMLTVEKLRLYDFAKQEEFLKTNFSDALQRTEIKQRL